VSYVEGFNDDPTTRFTQRLWSIGAEADVPLGSRLALAGGIALDGAKTPETGGREPLDPRDDWAGRLGVTASLGATRLHAAASQRSRFPALRELYSGALGRFQPNPDLRPERLTTIEGGATHTRGALEVQGVVFHQVNEDGIIRTTLPDRKFFRVNKDEIRSTGLESAVSWSGRSVALFGDVLLQKVRVFDITDGDAERRPEHVPQVRGSLGIDVPTVAEIRASAWATHTGTQYCVHPDSGDQVALDGATRLDLGLDRAWRVARGWFRELRASVALDNVGDTAVYDQCGMPQPGRTVRAGLSLR
jgi:iron complex outermembrane receptor protein